MGSREMSATSEVLPRACLIRQGSHCEKHGDPYEWTVVVKFMSSDHAELVGIDAPVTKTVWRDVMQELHRLGIKCFLIHRIRGNERSWRWLKVKNYATV